MHKTTRKNLQRKAEEKYIKCTSVCTFLTDLSAIKDKSNLLIKLIEKMILSLSNMVS